MRTKTHLATLSVLASLAWVSAGLAETADVLYSRDFDETPPGFRPTFDHVRPSTNADNLGFETVEGGLRLWDFHSGAQTALEQNFVTDSDRQPSAVRFDFEFRRKEALRTDGAMDALHAMLGEYDPAETLGTQANRALELRLNNDGNYQINHGGGRTDGSFRADETNRISLFANAEARTFFYEGPDGVQRRLGGNAFDVFLNDELVGAGFTFLQSAFRDGEGGFGKFGFRTGNANAREKIDFVLRNIRVTTIPEVEAGSQPILQGTRFAGLDNGAAVPAPWQTSDGEPGISVRIGKPDGAPNEERWIEFRDASGSASASASLRQRFDPVKNGRLSMKIYVAEDHQGEFGIYLGEGEASSTPDRVVDVKTNPRGVLRVGSQGVRQGTPVVLAPGETHHLFIEFISANRDQFLLFVVGTYDAEGNETIHSRIEASSPPRPVSGLRITTDNAPSGAHFFIKDLKLIDRDA